MRLAVKTLREGAGCCDRAIGAGAAGMMERCGYWWLTTNAA